MKMKSVIPNFVFGLFALFFAFSHTVTGQSPNTASLVVNVVDQNDAAVYLSTLVSQDPETWGGLVDVPQINPE